MPYQNRGVSVSRKIYSLFTYLDTRRYDEIAPKIKYWIELALTQQLTTIDKLVEHVSDLPWTSHSSPASVGRFLKEFRDSPRRSGQARSFVNELCTRVFRWFTAASAEDLGMNGNEWSDSVARDGGCGFMEAASFIGHLIDYGLLDHELVRLHLIKSLTTHYYPKPGESPETVRVNAICRLFVAAGSILVQGLLEPEDVQACFKILETHFSGHGTTAELYSTKLEELRGLHATWLRRNNEEERNGVVEATEERESAIEISAEVETPVAFTPQDLPITNNITIPSPILQAIETSSVLRHPEPPPDVPIDDRIPTVSSPTLSISTISDLAPTEFDEGIREGNDEQIPTRHETFYLEDGNVEIVCRHTVFRVHSTVVSFSSPKLRDILSSSILLSAPMPEGCPRVVFNDSADDFAVLLKMIYTPGFPARNRVPEFTTFGSLLRMATKYGFSDIREGLVEDLKGAYPTKWEDFETARILGEDIFGSPKPHPNAVLNLLLEQRIKFALPFAAYRAAMGGFSSLISDEPGTTLPRLTLASAIHGMGGMRRAMSFTAQTIAYTWDLGACPNRACALNVGINLTEQRADALRKIFDAIVRKSEGDMLSSLAFGNLLCAGCARRLESSHRDCRRQFVWARLPSLLGWEGWESIS